MVTVRVVYDNNPYAEDLKADWGFACVIETPSKVILFDTGADGAILLENMSKMNVKISDIDSIVISHDHYDHTGGLQTFLSEKSDVEVMIPASFSESFKDDVRRNGAQLIEVKESQEICDGVFVSGEIDGAIKEQCLIVETKDCFTVVTGCAHPGIVKMVEEARKIVGNKRFFVLGGFHLFKDSKPSIVGVVEQLERMDVVGWGPCHCSGDDIREYLKQRYKQQYVDVGVGKVLG